MVYKSYVYATLVLEAEAYVRPKNPGRLQLEEGLTQHQIVQRRDEHVEATRVFREVLGVNRALREQIGK